MARRTFIDTANAARLLPTVPDLDLGSGIETVFGTVTLDATGEPIREFYTTGTTTFSANGTTVQIAANTAVVWRRTGVGSWGYQEVPEEWTTPTPTPDTTAPVAGTLAPSAVADTGFTVTVTGESDDRALATAPFRFYIGGTLVTDWQASASYTATGRPPYTDHQVKADVRDAAGNVSTTPTITVTTTPGLTALGALITADAPSHYVTLKDGDYTDKGSAPLTWTAEAGVTAGTWGAMVSGTSGNTGGRVVSQSAAGIGVLGGLSAFTVEFVGAWDRAGSMLSHQADMEIKNASTVAYDNGFRTINYTPVEAGTPAHYALVLEDGTLTAYRNGTVMGTAAFTVTRSMTYPLYVGYTSAAQVGQVAIYRDRALSAARIAEHAQAVGV